MIFLVLHDPGGGDNPIPSQSGRRECFCPTVSSRGQRLTARPARDIRSAMSAAMTVEREQDETKPPKRQPAAAHQDRFALDEISPFLLLAAAVVQHARMDQTHRCSSNCQKPDQCRRATISARLFLTALSTKDPAWGGVWLDWLEYAAARAGPTLRRRRGWLW